MANLSFKQYPNGYRVVSVLGGNAPVDADDEIVELYTLAKNNPQLLNDWDFKDRVFRAAVRLMGTGREWMRVQSINDALGKGEKDFLVDCLAFIKEGKRPFMISSRTAFFNAPKVKAGDGLYIHPMAARHNPPLVDLATWATPRTSLFQAWAEWKGGIADLLTSLYVFFGPVCKPSSLS